VRLQSLHKCIYDQVLGTHKQYKAIGLQKALPISKKNPKQQTENPTNS